jgi:SAM-dependent methyltransferase
MEHENKSIHEFDVNLICEYFAGLERQGPGSPEATVKALSFIDNLTAESQILDLGCGTGGQTMVLAQHVRGNITGIDLFPAFIDLFNANAAKLNLQERVKGVVGSMDNLPFREIEESCCQVCGIPMGENDELYGTEKDGSKNKDYCNYCYNKGELFTGTMDEMIEICIPYMIEGNVVKSEDEARKMMKELLPHLKHWRSNRNMGGANLGEFDLIWSEGAIANIGFEKGLNYWKDFLKKDGYIAVTYESWFTDERPAEIEKWWLDAVPEINTIGHNISIMQKTGYIPVASFTLPENCWIDNYFIPQKERQEEFLKKHAENKTVEDMIAFMRREADLYSKYKQYYGYVFYIGKKNGSPID